MQTYAVGGCVRDELLGLTPKDYDYVVVGATAQNMLDLGFTKVGADFPVFLHPDTKEEYALARTERKTGKGYLGFTVEASPTTTLEEDLSRRDLTINAMAKNLETGEIVDPFGGQTDLEARVLRHVSTSFAEDPVRVLRTARFAARYGFSVHPKTLSFMREVAPELEHVPQERIWAEIAKGLMEPSPEVLFETLDDCGALLTKPLQPYLRWSPRLRNVDKRHVLRVRFALAALGFQDEDYAACRVPTALAKVSKSFNRHGLSFLGYTDLAGMDKIRVLNQFRAISDTTLIGQVLDIYTAYECDVGVSRIWRSILADVEACRSIDVEQLALTCDKRELPAVLLRVRAAFLDQNCEVTT